jgi:hypothetical protein
LQKPVLFVFFVKEPLYALPDGFVRGPRHESAIVVDIRLLDKSVHQNPPMRGTGRVSLRLNVGRQPPAYFLGHQFNDALPLDRVRRFTQHSPID